MSKIPNRARSQLKNPGILSLYTSFVIKLTSNYTVDTFSLSPVYVDNKPKPPVILVLRKSSDKYTVNTLLYMKRLLLIKRSPNLDVNQHT